MNKKKIMILGMSPMPFENGIKVYGTGIRTWQFAMPLLEKGHKICIVGYAIPSAYPPGSTVVREKNCRVGRNNIFEYHILGKKDFEDISLLASIAGDFKPDCLVGCTFYPSYIAARLKGALADSGIMEKIPPLWADLFGHVMAEAQAKASIDGDDTPLFHYWNSEYNTLQAADIFSCVSKRQEYATVGELGATGRLNRHTAGYEFTHTIPCGLPEGGFKHEKTVIRGKQGISKDDFVILWSGGYNTWTDVDTLYQGLIAAMEKDASIKFVSTGGEIPEQDIKTYPYFLSLIKSGRFKERFLMKGWVPSRDVPDHYFEADIGINIDKNIYEVRLGSKNRILDWFRAGLCVLSSDVCELTEQMAIAGAGYVFRPGDQDDLVSKILMLSTDREKVRSAADAGKRLGLKEFSFSHTTEPLHAWVERPAMAPDYGEEKVLFFEKDKALKNMERVIAGYKEMISERDRRINEFQAIVKGRFPYKLYNYFKIAGRKIKK